MCFPDELAILSIWNIPPLCLVIYLFLKSILSGIDLITLALWVGFPGSSAGKESACSAGDPSSISGSGRSPREGIGYPLQYSWASLVAQTIKNLPAMRETWVRSLGWENFLKEGMATLSSILAWRIPMDRGAWWGIVHRVIKSWIWLKQLSMHACRVKYL